MLDLCIVIVNYNTKKLTLDCLSHIYKHPINRKYEVVVVDNASSDGSVEAIKNNYPKVRIIESMENIGFGKGNNLALKSIDANYYLLLNSDTQVIGDAIDSLVSFAKTENYDIASCKLVNPDGSFQPNAGELPDYLHMLLWLSNIDGLLGKLKLFTSYQENNPKLYEDGRAFGWVSGSVMLINKQLLDKIGYFDVNLFMYTEDVDLCWRAKMKGLRIGWTSRSTICHLGGASSDRPKYNQWRGEFLGLIYLYRKYYGFLTALSLRIWIYVFVTFRVIGFYLYGKPDYAKTYAKIITSI